MFKEVKAGASGVRSKNVERSMLFFALFSLMKFNELTMTILQLARASFPKFFGNIDHYLSGLRKLKTEEDGDVPGWVLVVLMTTGLVTGIWTVAQPRLSSILKNSLDSMSNIR